MKLSKLSNSPGSTEYHLSTATVISDDLAQIFHAYSSPWIPSTVNSTLCIPVMAPTVSLVLVSLMWGVQLGNRLPSPRSRQILMMEFRPLQPYLPLTLNSNGSSRWSLGVRVDNQVQIPTDSRPIERHSCISHGSLTVD